jgi:hypothetical protein
MGSIAARQATHRAPPRGGDGVLTPENLVVRSKPAHSGMSVRDVIVPCVEHQVHPLALPERNDTRYVVVMDGAGYQGGPDHPGHRPAHGRAGGVQGHAGARGDETMNDDPNGTQSNEEPTPAAPCSREPDKARNGG